MFVYRCRQVYPSHLFPQCLVAVQELMPATKETCKPSQFFFARTAFLAIEKARIAEHRQVDADFKSNDLAYRIGIETQLRFTETTRQGSIARPAKEQVAGRRQRAAVRSSLDAPPFFLRDRIPRDEECAWVLETRIRRPDETLWRPAPADYACI